MGARTDGRALGEMGNACAALPAVRVPFPLPPFFLQEPRFAAEVLQLIKDKRFNVRMSVVLSAFPFSLWWKKYLETTI